VMFSDREPAEAMRARDMSIEGDQELATRLLNLYARPQRPAGATR